MVADEAKLIRRLKRRDEAAFTRWFALTRTASSPSSIVCSVTAQRQRTSRKRSLSPSSKAIDQFRGDSQFSTWLYRVATNHCKNRIKYLARRHHNRQKDIADTAETEFSGPLVRRAPRPDQVAEGRQMERTIQRGSMPWIRTTKKCSSCGTSSTCRTKRSPRFWALLKAL